MSVQLFLVYILMKKPISDYNSPHILLKYLLMYFNNPPLWICHLFFIKAKELLQIFYWAFSLKFYQVNGGQNTVFKLFIIV